jgi:hypothetical protein
MSKNKMHLKDNQLYVNAGMNFPTCHADAELLDLEKAWLPLTSEINEVTCKRCKAKYYKAQGA